MNIGELAGPISLFSWRRSEREAGAILRTHLQALLQAPVTDGVDVEIIRKFRDRWLEKALREAPIKARVFGGLAFRCRSANC